MHSLFKSLIRYCTYNKIVPNGKLFYTDSVLKCKIKLIK